ncbi:MAG: radical SAM protein [Syntrophobacteraceae bacterium]|nr:radical SAM protein [Syntrophobacteraceae bacterium]
MSESSIAIAARLLGKGVRFRYLKRTGNPGKVQAASIEVTHRCIARCIMCNIWKIPHDVPELSTAKWLQVLSSPLFSDLRELDVTGGEPFLKKDLFDLLAGVAELKKTNLKALRSVAVTTNGLLTERVLGETEKIVRELKRRDIELVMVCAMDAVGSIHDRIRNYPDAWLKVNETIEGLIKLRERHPLIIGLKTTVLPINAAELGKIADYAAARDLFTIISPCIITEGRYLNEDLSADLSFSPENIQEMIDFYQGEAFQWSYHREVLLQYLRNGVASKPCTCGFNYLFVRSGGDVYPCPLVGKCAGNVNETPVEDIFGSEAAKRIRGKVGAFPECVRCTEPGLERYALPCEGFVYLSLLLKMGRSKFLEAHRHMGLNKYL